MRDPALESALRVALRAEADAVPFRVRAADVRAAAATRSASRRRRLPAVLAACMAIVAVGVTAVAVATRAPDGAGSAPAAALAQLPSYERLLEVSNRGRELARGEGVIEGGAVTVPVPAVAGFHPAEVVFTCSGSAATLSAAGDGSPIRELFGGPSFECSAGVSRTWIAGPAALSVATHGLRIEADPGTAWRAMVVGLPDTADVIAGTGPVDGLPSFAELAEATSPSLREVTRASAAATAVNTTYRVRGLAQPLAMQSVLACAGGPLTLVWADGPAWSAAEAGGTVPCDGEPLTLDWSRMPPAADASELHVYAPAGTAWIMLVEDTGGSGSPEPAP